MTACGQAAKLGKEECVRPSAFSCFIRLQRIARYSAGVGAGQENGNRILTPDTPGEGLTARVRAASRGFLCTESLSELCPRLTRVTGDTPSRDTLAGGSGPGTDPVLMELAECCTLAHRELSAASG